MPALEALGVDWQVVATDKGATQSDSDFSNNDRVHIAQSGALPRWTFSWGIYGKIKNLVRECDVVHIHSIHTFPSSLAMIIARRYRTPYVLEPHGALDTYHLKQGGAKKRLYARFVDGRSLRRVSGLIYSTQMELAQGRLFLPSAPSYLMTLGVSPELVQIASPGSRSSSEILFLGRVTQKKRLDLLIRALGASPLRDTSARLIVAGPLDPQLSFDPKSLAAELGLSDRITFLGQVDSAERQRLLTSATVFALPSEDESFGIAVAEALATGCPVVCSDRVGIAADGAAAGALLLSELTHMDLARQLAAVLASPELQTSLSSRGQAFASSNFTWERSAQQAMIIYSRVIGGKES